MLFHDFLANPASTDAANDLALVTWNAQATWAELAAAIERAKTWLEPIANQRIGFQFSPSIHGFATLAALDFQQCETFLLDEHWSQESIENANTEFRFDAIVQASDSDGEGEIRSRGPANTTVSPGVTILTSGTEGKPKAARHTWQSLSRPVRISASPEPLRWLLAFRPHLYAGIQVMLQCFANRGCLVVPRYRAEPLEVATMIVDHKVQCVSATPSYWRRLVLFTDHEQWGAAVVNQITLGGEIVDQQILDALSDRFPSARIVHIYATTELGRCFAVADKKAGFPSTFLKSETDDGIQLCIEDGQLLAKSANAMQSYIGQPTSGLHDDEWWRTGDLVEQSGERVFFLGRAGDTINVGGNKVKPARIENLIRGLPGVANVQIYGVPSSITGQLVACRIVREKDATEESIRASLPSVFDTLSSFQRPRVVEFVDEISIADSGKTIRSNQ